MINKCSQIFLILLISTFFEFSNLTKSIKASRVHQNSINESAFKTKTNKFNNLVNNKKQLEQSFYKNGYTYEESSKIKYQIFDLLGISFKNQNAILSFPEQRIESDAFQFWKTYKTFLENQVQKDSKVSTDLENGFNTSLFRVSKY